MCQIDLTEKQKDNIIIEWNTRKDNPPSLLELIQLAFGKEFDGRSKEGKAVKKFLSTRDIRARASHEYKPKEGLILTSDQEKFIKNNASTMTSVEMARVIFKNETISNLHQETRAVNGYIKNLDEDIQTFEPVENVPVGDYKPPKTILTTTNKIIKFVPHGLNKEKISPKQKKDTHSLMGFLNTFRFLHTINNLSAQVDRDLFESSFIRYTYDKHDLTQEEIDQYIVLAAEVVISSSIQARTEHLQRLLDQTANDTEGRRISMALVEAISSRQTEYNQSVNRQTKLLESLKVKRSDRLKQMGQHTASILNLVEMWKDEESRKQMIQLAEARKGILREQIGKISSMDDVKARIMGIGEDEILNG